MSEPRLSEPRLSKPRPHCQSCLRQAKWGRTACGSQKSRCPACQKVYVAHLRAHGLPAPVRQQAVRMSLNGINQRRTARLLSVNHQSVANWLKAYPARLAAQHPQTPQPAQAETVELDELYTFVGSKKRRVYACTAVDRATHAIVGWVVVEEHDWAALQGVVDRAPAARSYFGDGFNVYPTLLYAPGGHAVAPGKSQTYSVEGATWTCVTPWRV